MADDVTRRIDRLELRLSSQIADMRRDITGRQDRTNGLVGKAHDRASTLEGIVSTLRESLTRAHQRIDEVLRRLGGRGRTPSRTPERQISQRDVVVFVTGATLMVTIIEWLAPFVRGILAGGL